MKDGNTRFGLIVNRTSSRREMRRAWDRLGALVNRPLAPKPLIEDGVDEYEEALTARNEARETADLDAAFAALPPDECLLDCAACGLTFNTLTVPVGLACPHCGNTDW
jgi:hypothetical protein